MRTLAVRRDGIENGADIADAAGERAIGICVELDLRFLAELQLGNVVLVNIADDPDGGEIGDGEGRGRAGKADARGGGVGHILRHNDAGDGRINIDDAAGVVLVHAQSLQLLFGGGEVGLCVLLGVFGLLQHGLGDGAVLEKIFGAHVSLVGQAARRWRLSDRYRMHW